MTVVGLSWDPSTDTYVRLGATAGMSKTQAIAFLSGVDPWMSMGRCNLDDDGTVNALYGGPCYTDYFPHQMGPAMWRLKKYWYTTDFSGAATYNWYISSTGTDALPSGADHAWAVFPAFIRDGVTLPWMYLGAYEGYVNSETGKLESRAGVPPTGDLTIGEFRTAARLRGTGWEQQDYLTTCALQLPYLLEYGGFDSQTLLGGGLTNTTLQKTGLTTSYGNASYGVTTDYVHAVSYRGLENPYGNMSKWVDGIKTRNYVVWIADHDFNGSATYEHPYASTDNPIGHNSGIATDIAVTAAHDYTFLPYSVGGSNLLHDQYLIDTGDRVPFFGGETTWSVGAGMFFWGLYYTLTPQQHDPALGARLMYIGETS